MENWSDGVLESTGASEIPLIALTITPTLRPIGGV
jgi:hypothetical protein